MRRDTVCVCSSTFSPLFPAAAYKHASLSRVDQSPCGAVQGHSEEATDQVQGQDSSWSGQPGHTAGWHLHAGMANAQLVHGIVYTVHMCVSLRVGHLDSTIIWPHVHVYSPPNLSIYNEMGREKGGGGGWV